MKATSPEERRELQAGLNSGIGLYRAEYLGDRIFNLFTPPSYWEKLSGKQPAFLFGGRGTGKTHALRALAFDGQHKLSGPDIHNWSTIGFYWRVETNRVAAFRGPRLDEGDWIRLFSHFVNLQLVRLVLEFINWRRSTLNEETALDRSELARASASLGLGTVGGIDDFANAVKDELAAFENRVNRISDSVGDVNLSMLGSPVGHLLAAMANDEILKGHYFTFCIDEYENLENYQQKVLNTLIKHVGDSPFTFKIGARQTGLRERATLSEVEFMMEPADFISIDVVEALKAQGFSQFAKEVCRPRLLDTGVQALDLSGPTGLFPELSEEEEARLLGLDARNRELRHVLELEGATGAELANFDVLEALSAYMVGYWAKSTNVSALEALRDAIADPAGWSTRLGNYSYAMLFTVRRGRGGVKKFYSGWSTMVLLADGNIRYLLHLVTLALESHVAGGRRLNEPVAPSIQTEAATEVGSSMLQELQGLDARGAQLTRLALGLGRVFGVFAADPYGHTPEVAQFRVKEDPSSERELRSIIDSAVMHSCLKRFTGDKMALVSAETKDFDYQLHPIYAPFFLFSPRSKRRMTIAAFDLLTMTSPSSRDAIRRILKGANRATDVELPPQLALFSEHFYDIA